MFSCNVFCGRQRWLGALRSEAQQLFTAWLRLSRRLFAELPLFSRPNMYKSSAVAEMGHRFATIDMGRKVGAAVHLFFGGGSWDSPSNTMSPWAEAYLRTKWHLDPSSRLATTDMGRKSGGGRRCCAAVFGGAGSLFNTMWPGPRPTCIPSGILIHLTV